MERFCRALIEREEYVRPYKRSKAVKGGNVQSLDRLDRDVLDSRFVADICISAGQKR